jgi:uncharacterized membrane protein
MSTKKSLSLPWLFVVIGAAVGALASFIQVIERISYGDNPVKALSCDLNSVFSCSSVFDGWQSSVFGFSNSIMCLLFFGVMLGVGLTGLFGSQVAKGLRLTMQFFSVFFLFFGAWYLQQSAFAIGALCTFCMFCYSGVIAINWAWLRLNVHDLPLLSATTKQSIADSFKKGTDTFLWVLWAFVIAGMFVIAFK